MKCRAQSGSWVACTANGTIESNVQPVYQYSASGSSSGNFPNNPNAAEVLYPLSGTQITNPWYIDAEVECGYYDVGSPLAPPNGSASINGTQQADAYFIWAANGQPAPNPPASQTFLVNTSQYIYTEEPFDGTLSGEISDNFGLTDSIPDDWADDSNMFTSSGKYLVNVPVSNGIADVRDTSKFNGSVTASGTGDEAFVSPYEGINTVTPDTRSISIGSPLGQTYHKDLSTGNQVLNVPISGVLTDDTVTGAGFNDTDNGMYYPASFTNTGSYAGLWGPNSTYHWAASTVGTPGTDSTDSGTFEPDGINDFVWDELDPGDKGPTTAHVFLSAYDSDDGAEATANYYVNFHNQWENLVSNGSTDVTLNIQAPVGVVNNNSTPIVPSCSTSITGTATFGLNLTAGFTVEDLESFGVSYQASQSVSGTFSITAPGPTLDKGWESWPELCCSWKKENYLVDAYAESGYQGAVPQSADDYKTLKTALGWTPPQQAPL